MTVDRARRMKLVARWHRRLALLVAAWLVLLAGTGFVVNHANDWGLDRAPLAGPLQGWFYGIEGQAEGYCDFATVIGKDCSDVFARLDLEPTTLLLSSHSLWILDKDRQLLEQLPVAQTGLDRLDAGYSSGAAVFLRGGRRVVRAGEDLLAFYELSGEEASGLDGVEWQTQGEARGTITWERLLLDLHAARFLGPLSKAFNDLAAGLILLLAISGAWLHRLKGAGNAAGKD